MDRLDNIAQNKSMSHRKVVLRENKVLECMLQ